MRKWAIRAAILLVFIICTALTMVNFLKSVPPSQSTFTIGQQYWTSALVVKGSNGTFIQPNVQLLKTSPPSLLGFAGWMRDSTALKLLDIEDNTWCQVEGDDMDNKAIVGWLPCERLLNYKPTPVPH